MLYSFSMELGSVARVSSPDQLLLGLMLEVEDASRGEACDHDHEARNGRGDQR
jgi:hypothetical protein